MNTINTKDLINFLLQNEKVEKSISINLALKLFYDKLKLHNRKGTIKAYNSCFAPLIKYFEINNISETYQLTTDLINNYVLYRKPLVKAITINKEITALKTMLSLLIEYNHIDHIPFKFKRLKQEKTTIDKIEKSDIVKICKLLDSNKFKLKYKLAFYLILTTGIRTTELINIKNRNIDLRNKRILLDFTKTHKARYIYLIDEIIDLVKTIMNDSIFLFTDKNNNQLSDNALRCFFKKLKTHLNIHVLSPHKLRHYYATTIYNKSLDVYLVSNLLGHSDIKTTQIYLDIDNKDNQVKNQFYNPLRDLLNP